MKRKFLPLLVALLVAGVVKAGAIIGATEITQILNNIQLAATYAESAQQTYTQIRQYETMLKNLKSITPSHLLDQSAQKLFTDQKMFDTFRNLQKVVVDGQSLAYNLANVDARFKQMHPGYGNFKGQDFAAAYGNWSNNTLDRVKGSMSLVAAHADDFATEEQMIRQLQSRSATAEGQQQALQAGNEISMAMVSQMQKMRQLQMAQMNAQNAFLVEQKAKDDSGKQATEQTYRALRTSHLK